MTVRVLKCLQCDQDFQSAGAHNVICPICKASAPQFHQPDPFTPEQARDLSRYHISATVGGAPSLHALETTDSLVAKGLLIEVGTFGGEPQYRITRAGETVALRETDPAIQARLDRDSARQRLLHKETIH